MKDQTVTNVEKSIDPTDRVMLKLLRANLRMEHAPHEAEFDEYSTVNWQELARRAIQLSVAPMIYDAVRHLGIEAEIPREIYQKLQEQSNVSTLYNMVLYRQLHELLLLYSRYNVNIILLKGIYLAKFVYGNVGLRPMSDIDLLVRQSDRYLAHRLLAELGFRPGNVTSPDDNRYNPLENSYHNWFSHPGKNLNVEIHWTLGSLDSKILIDTDALWERAAATQIAGLPIYQLSPVDTLLHQCIHLGHHHIFQRFSLRGICDVHRLIDHYGDRLDWNEVYKRTAQWQAQRCVYLVLLLARTLLGAAVPPFILEMLCPLQPDEWLQLWAVHRVLGKVDDSEGPWASNLGRWHLSSTWSEKLAVAMKTLVPPPHQFATPLHKPPKGPQLWISHLQRWSRLATLPLHSRKTQDQSYDQDRAPVSWREREVGRIGLINWLYEKQ